MTLKLLFCVQQIYGSLVLYLTGFRSILFNGLLKS